jgi:hypothetical protein
MTAMRNWKYAEIFTSVLGERGWELEEREMSFEDRDGF